MACRAFDIPSSKVSRTAVDLDLGGKPLKPLRVGIIGTGRISGSHITGYLATEGIELYGVCDVVEERAVAASEKHSIAHVFKNFEALVNCPEIDLVSVCTPPFAHKDPTIAALEAGKHVLCEKPMALTAMEAEAMVDAWEHARVRTATFSRSGTKADGRAAPNCSRSS